MSYEDTQRSNVIDEEEELPKKQEAFRRILEKLRDPGEATTLLNYYKTWPRAYSVSEKLLAHCIILIIKEQVDVHNLNWGKLENGISTRRIVSDIASETFSKKDQDENETKLKLQLNTIRYLRLAEQFLAESSSEITGDKIKQKMTIEDLSESDEGEEAPE